jgi:predicted permease
MLIRRLWHLLNRRRRERELEEEMAAHLECLAPADRPQFGDMVRLREQARDAWGWNWLDAFAQDLRFGYRILGRQPGHTASVVAVLGLGTGVALTVCQVFNVLVLRPLPVKSPDNLYEMHNRGIDSLSTVMSFPEYRFIRDNNRALSAVFAQMPQKVLTGRDGDVSAAARFVTSNYLAELGAQPVAGRILDARIDGRLDADAAVVLGHAFWQQRFGANPAVVGRTLLVDGRPATIVGVVSSRFSGAGWSSVDVWIPIEQHAWYFPSSDLLTNASKRTLRVLARLGPGINKEGAEASLRSVIAGFRSLYPGAVGVTQWLECEPAGRALRLGPQTYEPVLFVVALVVLVLAISFSNAGALQLSRSLARTREMWIRASLGAGRSRLMRQVVTEALLLAAVASAAGLAIARLGTVAILASLDTPLTAADALDARIAMAAGVLALAAATFGSAAPTLRVLRRPSATSRLRGVLIAIQVMATCVLLVVASLWVRGLQRVVSTPLGFEYRDVVLVDPHLSARGYSPERSRIAIQELLRRAEAAPGVMTASLCTTAPLGGGQWIEGIRGTSGDDVMAQVNAIDSNYLRAMRISLLSGRTFARGERDVAIVSESLARRAWPGENPLGRLLDRGRVVVGVAANARAVALKDGEATEIYYPFGTVEQGMGGLLVIRLAGDPRAHLRTLREALTTANEPPLEYTLLADAFTEVTSGSRKGATAIGAVGILALFIAATGIAGLLSGVVAQRTKEIGIRAAIGASPSAIVRTVVTQVAISVGAGLVLGGVGGYAVSGLMRNQIYGVSLVDPLAYGTTLGLLAASAALATVVPIKRALSVNPVDALRQE